MRVGKSWRDYSWLLLLCSLVGNWSRRADAELPVTGPVTEERFPSLVVPEGFKATLFACDPLVEYPSVIALGPRQGTVFVAHDYMTGLGTEIVRRDEIRLLEDADGDGYADKSTEFAGGFNSIQGLASHADTVFAMHAPFLTALRDTDGDGVADERRDLLSGLGLMPEENSTRLHCANGLAVGYDGWLYLALGDNGVNVPRPEGDRLVLNGGGILRCRHDGRDLHVFSTGLRNIYDVALDDELNVFVRDNENDGGDYLLRVCHSFYGADHGYPYLYYERPNEAVVPLAELGRGSSAGGACYLETAFPSEFRGNLFFCEWGRAVVRCERTPSGSGFSPTKEVDFAAGAPNDPYGFHPTDVIVDRDGSLLISDWGDGQRPKRGRGRVYRISYTGANPLDPSSAVESNPDALLTQLGQPGLFTRVAAQTAIERSGPSRLAHLRIALNQKKLAVAGRRHAVWILAALAGRQALEELFEIAASDPSTSVRVQAVRAIADLTDPTLQDEATGGAQTTGDRLAKLASGADPRIVVEIVVALGRLRWNAAPEWLRPHLTNPDPTLDHAAMQLLRRCDNWPAVLNLLDLADDTPIRQIALRAIADQYSPTIVDGLVVRLGQSGDPRRTRDYADALTRVFRKPGPWTYWGYRPPPRPVKTVDWERTSLIAQSLDDVMSSPDRDVLVAILKRMQREQVPVQLASITRWLNEERDKQRVDAILDVLVRHSDPKRRDAIVSVIRDVQYAESNRLRALTALLQDAGDAGQILGLAQALEDGPVLGKVLLELGKHPDPGACALLVDKLDSAKAEVRAAAVSSLFALPSSEAGSKVVKLLEDPEVAVRRAAAGAAGRLAIKETIGKLMTLARDSDPATRSASLDSLRLLGEQSAISIAVDALKHSATQLAALNYLEEFGGPKQVADVVAAASANRSVEILDAAVRALANWESMSETGSSERGELQDAISQVHGESGLVLRWHTKGPLLSDDARRLQQDLTSRTQSDSIDTSGAGWLSLVAGGVDARVELDPGTREDDLAVWLACSELLADEPGRVQFLASSDGELEVWLNGRWIWKREKVIPFQPDSDRFEADVAKGENRLVVRVTGARGASKFHLRFRQLGSSAEHERMTQFVLQNAGDASRGRELFLNSERTLCVKCHRLDGQGGTIGPDLTGIGGRFSRIHLIESVLEPSRTIAPSYETLTVALSDGRVVTGVKVSETETMLTLGDEQGKSHEIAKTDIDERARQLRSTMPEGLEKRFSDRELLDLLTFLVEQKKDAARGR
jgi:putative membrane-bound dehydrogenase-like protein